MSVSHWTQQVPGLRSLLVKGGLALTFLGLSAAFVLAWNERPGVFWFLGLTYLLYVATSITATRARVSARDFHGIVGMIGKKTEGDAR